MGVFLPFDEEVIPNEYRNIGYIESAVARPFQTAFGEEVWPDICQKAAALFHSLACNHCFINGNKRTAVIALDIFLIFNDRLLTMNSDQVYAMAKATVLANLEGRRPEEVMRSLAVEIESASFDINLFKDPEVRHSIGEEAMDKIMSHVNRMAVFTKKLVSLNSQT